MKTPTTLIIMDGFGLRDEAQGNAVKSAPTPVLDKLFAENPTSKLSASGIDVGLPAGQMGNSEVGHTNIGAGRVVYQDLPKISRDIDQGTFFQNPAYKKAMLAAKDQGRAVHIMGLLSDGGGITQLQGLVQVIAIPVDRVHKGYLGLGGTLGKSGRVDVLVVTVAVIHDLETKLVVRADLPVARDSGLVGGQ